MTFIERPGRRTVRRGRRPALLAAALLSGALVPALGADAPLARVAFVVDAADPFADDVRNRAREELLALARDDFDLRFPAELVVTVAGRTAASEALERLLRGDRAELVVAQGLTSSELTARGAPWRTPVIATSVFDPRLQGFPQQDGRSGVANLTYIAPPAPGPLVRDLVEFRELARFSRVGILADEAAAATFPSFIERLRDTAAELGIALEPIPVGATAASALERLPAGIEAVYVTPLTHLGAGEFSLLADALAERGLPSFSYSAEDVGRGIMASLGANDVPRLARRIALNAYRILLGDDAGALPVTFEAGEELVLNMRTVRRLGVTPPIGSLLAARRLFENPEAVARTVTLAGAMREALTASLALRVEDEEVLAGLEDVRLARAGLLPNLEATVSATSISKDVAESSFGLRPRHNADGGLRLRQVIFSEPSLAELSARKSLQRSRELDRAALALDVALEAAEAYLSVLRGKTLEQVQQDNLDLTLASLRLSRERERLGAAGPGERLRLESELARRRADRIDAFARRSAAEVALNQVLDRPLDEPFATPDAGAEGRTLLERSHATGYLADLARSALLGDFLVVTALELSPEVQGLDAAVAAQERLLASARGAFHLPTVALVGDVSTNIARDGAGSSIPDGLPVSGMPDRPWSVGVSVSLPLYQGNARSARRDRTAAVLRQLRLQREVAGRAIEQGVRVQLQFARASLAMVGEAETAAATGARSLELVTQAYRQGIANVVDLLEAQTSALVSERAVTNAIFDYLVNLKRVERAVGRFEALSTRQQRADLLRRLEEFAQGRGKS